MYVTGQPVHESGTVVYNILMLSLSLVYLFCSATDFVYVYALYGFYVFYICVYEHMNYAYMHTGTQGYAYTPLLT